MPDDAARWRRLESVVHAALARPAEERAAFLAEACSGDSDLQRDAASLLEQDGRAGEFLGTPLEALAAGAIFAAKGTPPMDEPRSLSGSRIGAYEIRERLGSGGMGIVYRARDTRLHRDVAVKVLLPAVTDDPDRLARFAREARILASLNHPHIAQIHGLEDSDGVSALVMELVEGPTLADRIARGAIPSEEALGIAKQIADALEAAHAQGIIHRDLKPANVKVRPDGTVKVLDFGLAKAVERPGAPAPGLSISPPITTSPHAEAGPILGTAAYMSPEQARGLPVDARTDIWAFGCVLFEMLSGRRTFGGETPTETIAKIIEVEPDWRLLDDRVPARVHDLLARCLTKDPRNRLHDIADARIEIERGLTEPVVRKGGTQRYRLVATLAAALAAGAAGIAVGMLARSSPPPAAVIRTVIPLRVSGTPGTTAPSLDIHPNGIGASLAISPDGRTLAYRMRTGETSRLYVRRLEQLEATVVEGSEGASLPIFAPDGQSLGFVRNGALFRAALTGGAPTRIADGIDYPRGIDWCGDEIVFSSSGLHKVSSRAGLPTALTSLDLKRREKSHRFPEVLPGCRAVLFTIGTSTTESWDDGEIAIASMETGQYRTVVPGGVFARYSPTGHIVYNRGGTLYAVAFDLEQLEVTGPPVPVLAEVMSVPAGGSTEFEVAMNGTLVYAPGRSKMAHRQLVRVDRRGVAEPFLETSAPFHSFRLSPDGHHLAAHVLGGIDSIWLFDIARGAPTRWTAEWDNIAPIWDPTGSEIIYTSPRQSAPDLYRQPVGGRAAERIVASEFTKVPTSWSPDGTTVAYQEQGDIYTFRLEPGSKATAFVTSRAREGSAAFSPSGGWLAYVSDESGEDQVYVRRFPDATERKLISVDGGTNPVWSPDGTELFYRNGPRMMAVAIRDAANMIVARPQLLYERRFGRSLTDGFDVTHDGRYFIDLDDAVAEPPPTELVLVQHFATELRRLAPPGR